MRTVNPVDFWRGLALVMIFINHVPGNVFSAFTLRQVAISDAAELFVFLAGWSLSYAVGDPAKPTPVGTTVMRLLARAVDLYRAQIALTMIALAILAGTAIATMNPVYLEWYNAASAFYDPVRTSIGMVLLTFQVGYFNILPMYVVILGLAPLFVLLARLASPALALAASLALYLFALATGVSMPSWPSDEQWYFNPLAWQVLLVMGFLAADASRRSPRFVAMCKRLVIPAALLVAIGAAITLSGWRPDPLRVPSPRLMFLFDKTFLSPTRIVSLLAIAVAFHAAYDRLAPLSPRVVSFLCCLGRNSLAVFCMASLMSLGGQIARSMGSGSIFVDVLIVFSGLLGMRATAWFVEWRSRAAVRSP